MSLLDHKLTQILNPFEIFRDVYERVYFLLTRLSKCKVYAFEKWRMQIERASLKGEVTPTARPREEMQFGNFGLTGILRSLGGTKKKSPVSFDRVIFVTLAC